MGICSFVGPDKISKAFGPGIGGGVAEVAEAGQQIFVYDPVVVTVDAGAAHDLIGKSRISLHIFKAGVMKFMGRYPGR